MRELSIYEKRDMAQNKADNEANAEKLQAARVKVNRVGTWLEEQIDSGGVADAIDKLIDAKIELALLERGGG